MDDEKHMQTRKLSSTSLNGFQVNVLINILESFLLKRAILLRAAACKVPFSGYFTTASMTILCAPFRTKIL